MTRALNQGATPTVVQEGRSVSLAGEWTLRRIAPQAKALRRSLEAVPEDAEWKLQGILRLDSFAATLIWLAWNSRWPKRLEATASQRDILEVIARQSLQQLPQSARWSILDSVAAVGALIFLLHSHVGDLIRLLGQLFLDLIHLVRYPADTPFKEISAAIYTMGVKALPIAALVGFLIGVVLSYLSALQLRAFGADVFIVNILGLGIIRELGPVLVSILVAGRSGSAMTAQLGVMRVTEEIDALSAMGISRTQRLVLPKILALTIAMPLLVIWTSAMALFGGMVAAWIQLDMSFAFFVETLPQVVPIANLYIGFFKGALFGFLIALIACHFGLRVQPNTASLAANTTASVVSAITLVILADAVLAIATRSIGVPM